jgi:hypothetical protein
MLLEEPSYHSDAPALVAVLGREMSVAIRRWPGLSSGLELLVAAESERMATQLVICQLPRVDKRLLAIMWLLAETWGQVTPSGTRLPLELTHDLLGELVGARRSTVTLALGKLSERGAIVRQANGWLLLEPLPGQSPLGGWADVPSRLPDELTVWRDGTRPSPASIEFYSELRETVARLAADHAARVDRHRNRLDELARTRKGSREVRQRISREATRRRNASGEPARSRPNCSGETTPRPQAP